MKRSLLIVTVFTFLALGVCFLCGSRKADFGWIVMAVADAFGFEPRVVVPERPSSVPHTAVWAGGADGGAWIECSVDREKNANWCTVWNDQTGEVWARTFLSIKRQEDLSPIVSFSTVPSTVPSSSYPMAAFWRRKSFMAGNVIPGRVYPLTHVDRKRAKRSRETLLTLAAAMCR